MACSGCLHGTTRTWECVRVLQQLLHAEWMADPRMPEVDVSAWYNAKTQAALEYVANFHGGPDLLGQFRADGAGVLDPQLRALGLTAAQVDCVAQAQAEYLAAGGRTSSLRWWLLGGGLVLGAGVVAAVLLGRRRRGLSGPWLLAPNGRDYYQCQKAKVGSCCAEVRGQYDEMTLEVRCNERRVLKRKYESAAEAMRVGAAEVAARTWNAPRLRPSLSGPRVRYLLRVRDPETGRWELFQEGLSYAKASRLATAQIRAWRGEKGQTVYVTPDDVRVELM